LYSERLKELERGKKLTETIFCEKETWVSNRNILAVVGV
jgi:hypothetical protein